MKKYGFDAFDVQVLQTCQTQAELNDAEIAWIKKLNTLAPEGYNLRLGGAKGRHAESTKAKLRARIITPVWRARLSAAMKGRKLSPEHRARCIELLRKHKPTSQEKSLQSRGEGNGRAKLNWEKVSEIRALYKKGGKSQSEIAALYGVNQTAIGFIVRGVHWTTTTPKIS